jgi:uncharacterized protein YwqG
MPINWSAPVTYLLIALVAAGLGWAIFSAVQDGKRRQAKAKAYGDRPRRAEAERQAIVIQRGASVFSRIGGLPQLPESCPWPADDDGKPLAFLCQIDLAELPDLGRELGFPEAGALFFFYCQDQSVWGFDPKDFPKWRVIYLQDVPSVASPRSPPGGLLAESVYGSAPLGFSTTVTRSPDEDEREDDHDGDAMRHMMGGYPDAIQNPDMEEECALVSSGIYLGGPEGYQSAEAQAIRQRPNDWMLLLQLDSDEDAGMMWGDCGRLYFWIRKSDLMKKDFSRVWMILQCY